MVSLAANIAANHPKKGLCQLERLRALGVSAAEIDLVIDIARHLRDEAGQMLDAAFADEAGLAPVAAVSPAPSFSSPAPAPTASACCTPTAKGNACC
jgi:hypothetical protein